MKIQDKEGVGEGKREREHKTDRSESLFEKVHVDLFELGSSQNLRDIQPIHEILDLESCLVLA